MDKIKVGVVGYGTIGKRVADAVMLQKDMELVGVTAHSYNYKMLVAHQKGIPIYKIGEDSDLKSNGLKIEGDVNDLLKEVDVIVDAVPKKMGKENQENLYKPAKVKAIFQGGEKHDSVECSFTAQCNYNEAVGKNYVRVVSCNTTGLNRTLHAVDKAFGIQSVHATMIRRGADPWDIRHGPINAIVPVLELPSHHGPDVRTVLKDMEIFTTALSVPSTLMHLHTITADLKQKVDASDVLKLFDKTTRVRVVRNSENVRSTAEIMEMAKDLGMSRGDMPEICIWEEGVGTHQKKLFYMQAIHQESDVVPENVDAIRAVMGFKDGKKSIELTNKNMGIK